MTDTSTTTAPPTTEVSPPARLLRTLYMVLLAVAGAVPAATAAFGFTAATAAKIVGLMGGIVILVTAVWNALEGAGVMPTVHGRIVTPADTHFYVNGEKVGAGTEATLKAPAAKKAASKPRAPRR